MDNQWPRTKTLCTVTLIGVAYSILLFYVRTITGKDILDGALSIALGLFICSQPAMNLVDTIYRDRTTFYPPSSAWASVGWLTLNVASMLTGWIIIVIGLTRT